MKRKIFRITSITILILFISINIFLIMNKNSKVARINVVHDWNVIENGKIEKAFHTQGVVAPAEKHHIYMEKDADIKKFLVKKGDKVNANTPLFKYAETEWENKRKLLTLEIERLTKEKDSIDQLIQNLQAKNASHPSPNVHSDEINENAVHIQHPDYDQANIETEIQNKLLERNKVEQQIESYEKQLATYDLSTLTVVSGYEGTIAHISYDLKNPVITITSDEQIVEGLFSEEERTVVEEGQEVAIESELFKSKITGTLNNIGNNPENKPQLKKKSSYPFEITLDENEEKLYPGFHVSTKIITEKVEGAKVLPKESVVSQKDGRHIFILNNKGVVEKRPIQTGLEVEEKVELINGADLKEYYIVQPKKHTTPAPYVTPLQISKLHKEQLKETTKKTKLKYIIIGMLQR